MQYSSFITTTLKVTTEIAKRSFGKVSSTTKQSDNNQVLTHTDLEIGQKIIAEIQNAFPNHNIIDEEAGVIDKHSEFTWVVDPIDGTSNFANGVPTFGTMVGLLHNHQPIAGGLSLPNFNEIYVAEKGKGSFCNGEKLRVTSKENLLSALVAYGIDGHQENPQMTKDECALLAEIVLKIRNLRSSNSVFDIAMVVKGGYGAVLNRTSKIWDNVAQQILVEEAGGIYTNFFGKPMDYSNPLMKAEQNFTYCAAAPKLHEQLMKVVHQQ